MKFSLIVGLQKAPQTSTFVNLFSLADFSARSPQFQSQSFSHVNNFTMADVPESIPTQPEDLANFMDQIFAQMEQKFTDMAQQVLGRIDEMGIKVNELEQSIDQLMSQAETDAK
jgi:heat shock factor-binding protein 1